MIRSPDERERLDNRKLALIGGITVGWAMLEYGLQRLIWGLLALDTARGRLLTNRLNISSKADLLLKLLGTRRDKISIDIRFSLKAINGLSEARNNIVHGNWVWHHKTEELMLVSTRKPPRKNRDKDYVLEDVFEYLPMNNSSLEDLSKSIVEVAQEFQVAAEVLESSIRHSKEER